jgi:hypothetical protein
MIKTKCQERLVQERVEEGLMAKRKNAIKTRLTKKKKE